MISAISKYNIRFVVLTNNDILYSKISSYFKNENGSKYFISVSDYLKYEEDV
jgi:hypothetical protein